MAHKFAYPETESDFRSIQDEMYRLTKKDIDDGQLPGFKGLLDIASSKTVIHTAIHNMKSNKGSKTPGSDGRSIDHILTEYHNTIFDMVNNAFDQYKPKPVRRVYIPKPGKEEKRPLGIPAIVDRVIQECVKITIEPALEAQFFKHSYGFRPYRGTGHAIERIAYVTRKTKCRWIVEGDISKFFDTVNHSILIKTLYAMGIQDRRLLMVIKKMLKAGVMKETPINELGTPQGGIISPILANAYLHNLDKWIAREWEEKKTRTIGKGAAHKVAALTKYSDLKPAFFVRYADDWVLMTDSKVNAHKWKHRIGKYLEEQLKLKLAEEKTLITNVERDLLNSWDSISNLSPANPLAVFSQI